MTRHDQFLRQSGIMFLWVFLLFGVGCGSEGSGTGDIAAPTNGACARSKSCPTANAGQDQTVLVGSLVTLDGTESSSGTTGLITYQWTLTSKPASSTTSLAGATTVRPTFTPDVPGNYIVQLVVDDNGFLSKADRVTLSAETGNLPPTANAGPDRNVPPGTLVTMDGSGSHDPNGTIATYTWTLKKAPPKSQASLLNPTSATPSLTADVEGTYRLSLTVSDGTLTSSPDQVEITATDGNIAPVADAGADQTVETGQLVTLTGAGSADANGDSITYSWRFQSKPPGSTSTLEDAHTVSPRYTPDFAGFYVLSLVVNDGQANSLADTVVIDATLPGFANAVLQAYVKASNPVPSLRFGSAVAISGDTLAIGTGDENSCATGINGDQTNASCPNAGAVYVFIRTEEGWSQQAYIKASNSEAGDQFGFFRSVAISGNTLAVAAHGEDSCAKGINGDQSDNSCGSAGAVYIFTRTAGIWSQQAYVKASNTSDNEHSAGFGDSVALDGNTLAVGADLEYSCASGINGDETNTNCPGAGAVYIFTRTAGIWSQQAYIKASNTEAEDRFGSFLALSGDTLAVAAHVEDSCATGINGDQSNNGCPSAGAVYVFTRTAGVWSQQAYIKASNTGALAFSASFSRVALSGDSLVVGAPGENGCSRGINGGQANPNCSNAGAVYVFTRTEGVWSQQAYIKASNTEAQDRFGSSVALAGDTLAVGAYQEDSAATGINGNQADNSAIESGAVYIFTRLGGVWSQQAYIKASNTEAGDEFGTSIALDGDTLAVGAVTEDSAATGVNGNQADNSARNSGAVYLYVAQ
jgi:hypothetical protein